MATKFIVTTDGQCLVMCSMQPTFRSRSSGTTPGVPFFLWIAAYGRRRMTMSNGELIPRLACVIDANGRIARGHMIKNCELFGETEHSGSGADAPPFHITAFRDR